MHTTEYAFPFDAELQGGEYDRTYIADDFARYFRAFLTSGIISDGKDPGTNLQVIANGDMTTTLKAGNLIIDGYRYELKEDLVFTHSAADGVLNRIDRLSVTLDVAGREITANLREGVMSYDPDAPECRRNSEYRDYVVADVYIAANKASITQSAITDTRLDTKICGIAVPFANVDTTEIYLQLQALYEEAAMDNETWQREEREAFETWFEMVRGQLSEDAAGALQNQVNELQANVLETEKSITKIENTITTMESSITITVPAANWLAGTAPYAWKRMVSVPGMLSTTKVKVYPTYEGLTSVESVEAYDEAYQMLAVDADTINGGIILYCVKDKPAVDMKVILEGIGE